jgi:hypothetical protein
VEEEVGEEEDEDGTVADVPELVPALQELLKVVVAEQVAHQFPLYPRLALGNLLIIFLLVVASRSLSAHPLHSLVVLLVVARASRSLVPRDMPVGIHMGIRRGVVTERARLVCHFHLGFGPSTFRTTVTRMSMAKTLRLRR